jgi:glycosyltransferase involved in cell wall biosynthesis
MKLCFLAGANSVHSERWVRYFAEKGHEVHWVSLGVGTDKVINNTRFYLIKKFPFLRLLRPLFYALAVRKILREVKPDIFHVHQVWIHGTMAALIGYRPLVITPWGSDILLGQRSWLQRPLIKYTLRKGDLFTCDAEHMRKTMIELGCKPEKIKIIYFGTDTQKFNPSKRSETLRRQLLIFDSPMVISLRSFRSLYDVSSLVKAIPLVLQKIPSARFVIAGGGPQEGELKALAQELGVSESINFVGSIPNDELPQYLASSDLYVSTSLSDAGLAASTAEAMACGLPVIITNTAENNLWVSDGVGGYVVPVKTPHLLAEKIIFLLINSDLRRKCGEVNRKVISERNNYYKEMEKMDDIYKELLLV